MNLPLGRRYSALVQPHPRLNKTMSSTDAESFHFRNSYTPSSQSFLNDPDCISLRERLLKGDDPHCLNLEDESKSPVVTIDLLQRLIIHLREFEERCAASANYKDAKKIHTIQITVKDKIRAYMQSQISNSNLTNTKANSNFQNDTDRMESLRKKHEEELNKFDNETNEKIKYIEKLHQQSLERFEQSWTEKPRQYRKPSQHLIELKKTEQTLAKIGQYDLATQINTEASNLAKEESAEKQKRIVNDYKKAKKKLIEKQNRELQSIITNRAEQRLVIESKQQLEIDSANNRTIVNQQRNRLLYNSSKALSLTHTSNSRSTSNVDTNSSLIPSFTNIPTPKKSFVVPSYLGTRSSMRSRIYSLPTSAKANIWDRNAINGSRSSSVSNSEQQNSNAICDQQPSLLPPLIPPTDPSIFENEQKEKKKRNKMFQQAAIRREKEKRRRLELIQEEIAREKQVKEHKRQKFHSKNNNKIKVINNSIIENDAKQTISDTKQTSEPVATTDTNFDEPKSEPIETPDDDSEYYYYEEEEEIIEEEEESKEDDNQFVPIASCGSSSFHQLSSIIDENPFAETSEVISKINSSKSINNNSKVDFKINNSDNEDTDTDDLTKIKGELQKSKSDTIESKMYDPSDPLFHSVPSLKAIKDKKDNEILGAPKNARRFSSTASNNNAFLGQSTGLTSTSMSDFEIDTIPLDVTCFVNGSFTDPFDSTFNAPLDENYLNSLEGRPTSLSENTSTYNVKDLTKQIAS